MSAFGFDLIQGTADGPRRGRLHGPMAPSKPQPYGRRYGRHRYGHDHGCGPLNRHSNCVGQYLSSDASTNGRTRGGLGGLHKMMDWPGPILTDSGGFQVRASQTSRKMSEDGASSAAMLTAASICSARA